MEFTVTPHKVERRLSQRRQSFEAHGIALIRVRPGVDASMVDLSATGVLVETQRRLLPGASIEIHFVRDKRLAAVRGRVLRCAVVRLEPTAVCYRVAVLFDQHLSWLADDPSAGIQFPSAKAD
jgi:hypothetical protein